MQERESKQTRPTREPALRDAARRDAAPRRELSAREVFDALFALVGTWRGRGRGRFPTIEDFVYEEELRFAARDADHSSLHYEQRTHVLHPGEDPEASHWESGFLQVVDSEAGPRVELLNAQNSGRVEVMRGPALLRAGGFTCRLESLVLAHDPRMRSTTRTLEVHKDELRYACEMATDRVAHLSPHLEATLHRLPHPDR